MKKALQGSKNDYWEILSSTTNLFYYYLFRTEEKINYKFFRKWVLKSPLYIESNDETIKKFILQMNKYKNCSYRQYCARARERESPFLSQFPSFCKNIYSMYKHTHIHTHTHARTHKHIQTVYRRSLDTAASSIFVREQKSGIQINRYRYRYTYAHIIHTSTDTR